MNKPTQEELNAWEETLRKEGLGINRGRNTDRLNYGYEGGNAGTRTWDDIKVYTPQKRKPDRPHAKKNHECVVCGESFLGRTGAKCCPRPKRCRLHLERRKTEAHTSTV